MRTYKTTKVGVFVFTFLLLTMIGLGFLGGNNFIGMMPGITLGAGLIFILWLFLDVFSFIKILKDGKIEIKNFSPILREGKISDIEKIERKNLYAGIPLFGKVLFLYLKDSRGSYSIKINQNLYKEEDVKDFIKVIKTMNKKVKFNF